MTTTETYDANDLQHLEGLDGVRKRPGMYIGTTDSKGKTHLVFEVLDNAVDEALAGHCTEITVSLHDDGSVEVSDNGRGIPTGMNTKTKMSGVELVFTKLHAGGKFGGSGYKSAGGLHGVGASVVNALSVRTDVKVVREGEVHEIGFQRGKTGEFTGNGPDAAFTKKPGLRKTGKAPAKAHGTTVRFWPDNMIFPAESVLLLDAIVSRARQTAFLVPNLRVIVKGQGVDEDFQFAGGIADMVDYLAPDKAVTDTVLLANKTTGTFTEVVPMANASGNLVSTEVDRTVEVDIAVRWGTGYDTTFETFVNVVRTPNGGTHKKGFERALSRVLIEAVKNTRGLLKPKDEAPTLDDVLEGLTAVVGVHVPEPQFVGQTKDELGTKGAFKVVQTIAEKALKDWLNDKRKKAEVRTLLTKIAEASRVRNAQKATKDAARRKTALEGASMPAKLVDCRANGVDRSELFIVEGDSALGSARKARNSEYQALLPIRGKILNVQKATMRQMLDNVECAAIIQVLGASSGRSFDVSEMRYGRVILMADADVDGAHIRCLLITLFARYMRPVIEEGLLYSAVPPLHKITTKGRNPEEIYTYSQAEMESTVARLEKAGRQIVMPIPRYKGLGEMNSEELWETTMDPSVRAVRRITLEDIEAAEATLELLMGSAVEPRRDFIVENSDRVENIDA